MKRTRLLMMVAAAPLSSYYSLSAEGNVFSQPVLDPSAPAVVETLPETVVQPVESNEGKTDELSLAVAEEAKGKQVFVSEPEKPVCKYSLKYVLDGQPITESHATIDAALARVRALKMLGIVPATATL